MSTPTIPTEQFTALGRRAQQAAATAAEATTRALQDFADAVAVRSQRPFDPQVVTAATFDLAEKLLHIQREYVTVAVSLLASIAMVVIRAPHGRRRGLVAGRHAAACAAHR